MITKLVVRNFKNISAGEFEFTNFDLLVGMNNCGKSTILQALAIWQHCVDEFRRAKRSGKTGIQIVLPNFTALPVPEFNLLWKDKTERKYPRGKKSQEYILIEIDVTWRTKEGNERTFGVKLRYSSPQSIYAIPSVGWVEFRGLCDEGVLPVIAYVPPFSGLEPEEEWRAEGVRRRQVGKGQPGSILRNLLLLVKKPSKDKNGDNNVDVVSSEWDHINSKVKQWFSIELQKPKYEEGVDTRITCEYTQNKRNYDIIAGGSGFHQTLTLLAFLYGYQPTTILLDEPDAHLHVQLQREVLEYFLEKSSERNIQFIIATHAEELLRGVDANRIVSLLSGGPIREASTPEVIAAMSEVSNLEVTQLRFSPFLVYVEGDTDERIMRALASRLGKEDYLRRVLFRKMQGGSKQSMKDDAERHFRAVRKIVSDAKRVMVFDFDSENASFRPEPDNEVLFEWKRKNIENYLLVPDVWKRAALKVAGPLFASSIFKIIEDFFTGQNLTLPPQRKWVDLDANVFQVVDGKKILFDSENSLFNQLRRSHQNLSLPREIVAGVMDSSEIHNDVRALFEKIQAMVGIERVKDED